MDSYGGNDWDLIDYTSFLNDNNTTCNDFAWLSNPSSGINNYYSATEVVSHNQQFAVNNYGQSSGIENYYNGTGVVSHNQRFTINDNEQESAGSESAPADALSQERESSAKDYVGKKRGRTESCCRAGTKACREKMRREKLNERFDELSSVLEPGRPPKTDRAALLGDATRVLTQLRTEAKELKEENEKLQEEIKNLKAEKNELREEKSTLKADKARLEQQLKVMPPSPYMPPHPPSYHAGPHKMPVFPYGFVPMWQYLPQTAVDTSRDHELRPPAA